MAYSGQLTSRFLQKIQYLLALAPDEQETLQRFTATTRDIDSQTELISQGASYPCGYILHAGWAIRAKMLPNGKRQILDFVLPGDVIGFAAPFFAAADHSVTTLGPTSVTMVTFAQFTKVLHTQPRLAAALCWQLTQEEAIICEHLVNIGRRDAYTRIAHLYVELYWRLDAVGLVQNATYTAPLSQTMLADALGLSLVHVNRTLRRLRQDGRVHVDGSQVVLRDREALERRIDFEHAYLYMTCTPVWLRRYRARERSTP